MKTRTETWEKDDGTPPGTLESNVVTVTETAPHSIDLSCNAKGQYSWSIKLYFKDEDKEAVVNEVEKINNLMLQLFPNVDDLAKIIELDKKAKK